MGKWSDNIQVRSNYRYICWSAIGSFKEDEGMRAHAPLSILFLTSSRKLVEKVEKGEEKKEGDKILKIRDEEIKRKI